MLNLERLFAPATSTGFLLLLERGAVRVAVDFRDVEGLRRLALRP